MYFWKFYFKLGFILQLWHSISITVDVCLLMKCPRSISELLKLLKMNSEAIAQPVTCCIFDVTTRLLFTHTCIVDKCLDIVKVLNISTSFPGLRNFYFQRQTLSHCLSHSSKPKKFLWDGSKEKTWGLSHTDWPFARQAPVPSKAFVSQMISVAMARLLCSKDF